MAELPARERLQPSLLDRLTDDDPGNRQPEPREARVMNRSRFRQAVLRDLVWLLSATRPVQRQSPGFDTQLGQASQSGPARGYDLSSLPFVESSVLNFGLPALSGESASSLDSLGLEESIKEAIQRYEPRIPPSTLQVRVLDSDAKQSSHNVVSIEIRGNLWAHPVPLELLLRTELDLETGEIRMRDVAAPGKS